MDSGLIIQNILIQFEVCNMDLDSNGVYDF